MVLIVGVLVFGFSAVLLLFTGTLIAQNAVQDARGRFWIFLSCYALELGAVSLATSLFTQLNPFWWLVVECGIFVLVALGLRRATRMPLLAILGTAPAAIKEWL